MNSLLPELMLLSIKPESGGLRSNYLRFALAGEIFIQLINTKRIRLDEKGKVHLVDPTPLDAPLFDEALARIVKKKRSAKSSEWILTFSNSVKKLLPRSAESLVMEGTLQIERKRFLGLIPYSHYKLIDRSRYDNLVDSILAILRGKADASAEQYRLIHLANAASLVTPLIPKEERKELKARLKEIGTDQMVDKAIREAMAAALAATTAATVAATASSSSGS